MLTRSLHRRLCDRGVSDGGGYVGGSVDEYGNGIVGFFVKRGELVVHRRLWMKMVLKGKKEERRKKGEGCPCMFGVG
jgi:hypothetical protein